MRYGCGSRGGTGTCVVGDCALSETVGVRSDVHGVGRRGAAGRHPTPSMAITPQPRATRSTVPPRPATRPVSTLELLSVGWRCTVVCVRLVCLCALRAEVAARAAPVCGLRGL